MRLVEITEGNVRDLRWEEMDGIHRLIDVRAKKKLASYTERNQWLELHLQSKTQPVVDHIVFQSGNQPVWGQTRILKINWEQGDCICDFTGFRSLASRLPALEYIHCGHQGFNVFDMKSPLSVMFAKQLRQIFITPVAFGADQTYATLSAISDAINEALKRNEGILGAQQRLVDAGLHEYAEIK